MAGPAYRVVPLLQELKIRVLQLILFTAESGILLMIVPGQCISDKGFCRNARLELEILHIASDRGSQGLPGEGIRSG